MNNDNVQLKYPEFDIFLDKLLIDAHGDAAVGELGDKMRLDLSVRLSRHVLAALLQDLPNEKAEDFDRFMNSQPGEEEIKNYFQTNLPDVNKTVADALLEFRNIYLSAVKE